MPTPTIREAVAAAAEALATAARAGTSIRASLATQNGLHDVYASYAPYSLSATATSVRVDGPAYSHTVVADSATPAKKLAEKEKKPEGIKLTAATTNLVKYGVKASLTLEQLLYNAELERVVGSVLLRQCVQALDKDIAAALATASATTTTATGSGAVLSGVADLLANGGTPSHIALNPADWAAIVGATANGSYLNMANVELGPSGLLFGLRMVPSSEVPAKTAYVYDASALVVAEHVDSPLLFLGPMSDTNESLLVVDLVAVPVLANPAAVTKVTV